VHLTDLGVDASEDVRWRPSAAGDPSRAISKRLMNALALAEADGTAGECIAHRSERRDDRRLDVGACPAERTKSPGPQRSACRAADQHANPCGAAVSSPDRTTLPIRRPAFDGTVARTLDGCEPDWAQIDHVHAAAGAPNVLVVLIDDAGFGNPSTFGRPIDTPNYMRMAESGVRYNCFHVTAYPHSAAEKVEPAVARAVTRAIGEAEGHHVQALKGAITDAQKTLAASQG
jgi:hypothetical protein